MMIFWNIIALGLIALVAWWLSGYDAKLSRENRREDLIRRIVRCGVTLFFVEVMIWLPPSVILFAICLAVLWASCFAEFFSHGFHWLIDPEDKRQLDPKQSVRQLDLIAELIRRGRRTEAIQLCESLKISGEVDLTTLELTLEHLGVPQTAAKANNPLGDASQLRREGKFNEARLLLDSLLANNPQNVEAAMILVRLHAQDLREPGRAHEVLRVLAQQPNVPAGHIEFARRSITEWSNPQPRKIEPTAPPESVDELLKQKLFGTAIEILENKIKEQPQDFELRMKLTEVHGFHCGNFSAAEKILQQLQTNPNFSPEQLQSAKDRQKHWREARSVRAA